MIFGDGLRMVAILRCDRDRIKSGFAISNQVTIIDDETTAKDPNSKIFSLRQWRVDVKFHRKACKRLALPGRALRWRHKTALPASGGNAYLTRACCNSLHSYVAADKNVRAPLYGTV